MYVRRRSLPQSGVNGRLNYFIQVFRQWRRSVRRNVKPFRKRVPIGFIADCDYLSEKHLSETVAVLRQMRTMLTDKSLKNRKTVGVFFAVFTIALSSEHHRNCGITQRHQHKGSNTHMKRSIAKLILVHPVILANFQISFFRKCLMNSSYIFLNKTIPH